jgi:hypothetical protein
MLAKSFILRYVVTSVLVAMIVAIQKGVSFAGKVVVFMVQFMC